jgi:MYXO-CTERM domain-containing protein
MKRFALAILTLCLFAAPAFAVQVGHLPANDPGSNLDAGSTNVGGGHNNQYQPQGEGEEKPTAPVPEPGTMALAAMSALALGAAARRRRNKQQ